MLKDTAFCHLQKKNGNKYGKKVMEAAAKTEIYAAKTASKRVVQKSRRSNWRFNWK